MTIREVVGVLLGLIIIGIWGFLDYRAEKRDKQNK